jgi:hypothetical protein
MDSTVVPNESICPPRSLVNALQAVHGDLVWFFVGVAFVLSAVGFEEASCCMIMSKCNQR